MELVTLREILSDARKKGYAAGAFNFNGYEDAAGIARGAAAARSAVILMLSQRASRYIGLYEAAGLVKGIARSCPVPLCLHLDHAGSLDSIREAARAGFSSVMIDGSALPYEENIRLSKEAVRAVSGFRCSVEAELGKVGGKKGDAALAPEAFFTDPAEIPRFVEETGVDALAVAFGSVHGFYKSAPKLDFARFEEMVKVSRCPLVLHGGTGIPLADIQRCIKMGLAKVNVGTELKEAFSNALRTSCAALPPGELDPQQFLSPVKEACAKIVKEKLEAFGSASSAARPDFNKENE